MRCSLYRTAGNHRLRSRPRNPSPAATCRPVSPLSQAHPATSWAASSPTPTRRRHRSWASRRETLATRGAVSAECAREMAEGARRAFGADLAVATTGIAGPGGATERKPVGLVYIGLAASGWRDHRGFPFSRRPRRRDRCLDAGRTTHAAAWSGAPPRQGIATIVAGSTNSPGGALDLDQTARRLRGDAARRPLLTTCSSSTT